MVDAEKVFIWGLADILIHGDEARTHEIKENDIKVTLLIDEQDADHKCSECSEFLSTHKIDETYKSIFVEFTPKLKFFYSFLNKRKEFKLQISIVCDFNRETFISREKTYKVENDENNKFGFCFFTPEKKYDTSTFQIQDITFECKLQQISESDPGILSPGKFFSHSLRTLLNNTKFSDVTLRIGKKLEIPAHKLVLHARSVYFEKMFSHETVESQINEVEVDFEVEAFLEVLRYMYTEEIDKLDSIGVEIFKIANYYQINDLESLCKNYFKLNYIDGSKIFDVLKLAHDYEISEMKNYFLNHLLINFHKFEMYKAELQDLLKTKPMLGYDLITRQHDLTKIKN